jgi:hypothetical protein
MVFCYSTLWPLVIVCQADVEVQFACGGLAPAYVSYVSSRRRLFVQVLRAWGFRVVACSRRKGDELRKTWGAEDVVDYSQVQRQCLMVPAPASNVQSM